MRTFSASLRLAAVSAHHEHQHPESQHINTMNMGHVQQSVQHYSSQSRTSCNRGCCCCGLANTSAVVVGIVHYLQRSTRSTSTGCDAENARSDEIEAITGDHNSK